MTPQDERIKELEDSTPKPSERYVAEKIAKTTRSFFSRSKYEEAISKLTEAQAEIERLRGALEKIDSETWILKRSDLDRLLGIVKEALAEGKEEK